MKMMDQPDPVGPYEETEQSVSPGLDAGQVEHLPSNQVQPGVEMFHIQPVADGPAGLVRTRHPVGNVMLQALQDGVRPSAGGPWAGSLILAFEYVVKIHPLTIRISR